VRLARFGKTQTLRQPRFPLGASCATPHAPSTSPSSCSASTSPPRSRSRNASRAASRSISHAPTTSAAPRKRA
jgi:hypothetical protein